MSERQFLIMLALLNTLVYSQGWFHPFVIWDDPTHIFLNPMVQDWWKFSLIDRLTTPNLGYPLGLPVALQSAVFATFGSAAAFALHTLSTFFHVANLILVFALAKRLEFSSPLVGVALWSLHPICVESIAWATNLKELLCAFFLLSCAIAWTHLPAKKIWIYGVFALSLVLGFISKPTFVIVVPILALVSLYRNGTMRKWELLFLAFVSVFSIGWVVLSQKLHSAIPLEDLSSRDPIVSFFAAIGIQAKNYVFPTDLQPIYVVFTHQWSNWATAGIMVFLCWFALVVWAWKSQRELLVGLFWAVIAYAPYSNVLPLPRLTADTYAYIPSIAVVFLVSLLVQRVPDARARLVKLILSLVVLILACMSTAQLERWSSTESLMRPLATDARTFPTPFQVIAMEAFLLGEHERAAEILREIWVYQTRIPYPKFAIDVFIAVEDYEWAERALNDWFSQNDSEYGRAVFQDYSRRIKR